MHKKILLAYDGTKEGRVALLECAEMAELLHAEVHLLAVMQIQSGLFLADGFMPDSVMQDEQKRIQNTIKDGIAFLSERGYNADGHFAYGEPAEEICRLATELNVDLIVLGHRKQASFAARWWKGSVGISLLEHTPCSILVAVAT